MACGGKEVKETIALDCYDVCTPGEKPDEACFRQKRDPDSALVETALAVASRYVDTHPPETAYWDWTDGVLMFALTELYRLTGETWLQDHYRTWMDAKIAEGYEIYLSDRCPPVLTALALYRETEAASYLEVVDTALHYLYEKALRTEQGGISHLGTNDVFGATLWLDSLFMFGMVLNRWGEVAADGRALDEMGFQLALFSDLLQKPSGLFLHAYNWPVAQDEDVFWGRGNAWITAAGFDYLRVRRLRRERDRTVEDLLARQVEALRGLQDAESGLWWTVLNRPGETYRETSAAALVVYGLARGYRYGFLGDDVLLVIGRALSGLKEKIVDDGEGRPRVTGISGPTTVGDFEHYASIGLEDDLSYGVGAVILALIECSGLPLPSQ
jgi:unsaturated rhamnogalacturonyl hydrolase